MPYAKASPTKIIHIYIQRIKIPGLRGAFKGDIAMNSETTYDEKNTTENKIMNGYQMTANAYKRDMARRGLTGEARADVERTIAALEFMANSEQKTHFALFDTTAFNDVCRGYILMALDNYGAEEDTRNGVMQELKWLFDSVTAEQAERYYTRR